MAKNEPAKKPEKQSFDTKKLGKRINGSVWKIANLTMSFQGNGSTGLYMNGGRWELISSNRVKIYDKTGVYRLTFEFHGGFKEATAFWVSGKKQAARRVR